MVTIASTPEMAAKVYATMERNLTAMAPGKSVECRVRHADGTTETLRLHHSFGAPQLDWFRAGSALNLFHGSHRGKEARQGRS